MRTYALGSRSDVKVRFTDLATTIRDSLNQIYDALRSVREQVHSLATHADDADLTAQAERVDKALTDIESELMQTKNESFQDPLNYPPMLDNQYASLYGYVAGPNDAPTEGASERLDDLNAQWDDLRSQLQDVLRTEVARFNTRVQALGTAPVFVPTSMRE